MSLVFNDVTFAWPPAEGDVDAQGNPVPPSVVFSGFNAQIPAGKKSGITVLAGPNGSGKSTFLLLASGRIMPQLGTVTLFGREPFALDQEQKNLLASVIYQNMEFESDEKVGGLLDYVYKNGALKGNAAAMHGSNLLSEVIEVFELAGVLEHGLTHISKGEIQRVLLAFSLLYGSASVFMDEPFFALEERQKTAALAYLSEYAAKTGTAIFIAMHELDLTRRYAQNVLLFHGDHSITMGTPDEVLAAAELEKAYGFPASMLKHYEEVNVRSLKQMAEACSCL